jgi:hypothetical protein
MGFSHILLTFLFENKQPQASSFDSIIHLKTKNRIINRSSQDRSVGALPFTATDWLMVCCLVVIGLYKHELHIGNVGEEESVCRPLP